MNSKRQSGTVKRLETLAKQIRLYNSYASVCFRMAELPSTYLNIHCRITIPGKSESLIPNLNNDFIREAATKFFTACSREYFQQAADKEEEFFKIIRMHFPDPIAQRNITKRFLGDRGAGNGIAPKKEGVS